MGVWERERGKLGAVSRREFERKALPFMRLFQPSMIQASEMHHLDRAGIDMLVYADHDHFPCVVQCKGFEVGSLGRSQINQILKSIEKFRCSDYSCDEYILLHNRTGENTDATQKIEVGLASLREAEKAETTRLWDRQTFIKEARKRLQEIIVQRMREDAKHFLRDQERMFLFGTIYVPVVPASQKRMEIRRGAHMRMVDLDPVDSSAPISEVILSHTKARWTLLTGDFGTGKTTTGLHAARLKGHNVIYVRGEDLIGNTSGIGTNVMLGRVVDAMGVLDDYDDTTREVIDRLAGRTLAETIRSPDSDFVLIIDGLDESRIYGTAEGMKRLTNELTDVGCPVILITRKEHFYATFSNFEKTFKNLSLKAGARLDGHLISLGIWTDREVNMFLSEALKAATIEQSRNLKQFGKTVRSGEAWRLYGDLPKYPLFLQMILEEAAIGQITKRNRAELIRGWIERKIQRDLGVDRATPIKVVDSGTFVQRMMVLMERVADLMTELEAGTWSLTEHIRSDTVEEEALKVFREKDIDISTILGCSVLSPVRPRDRGVMPIKFVLRICQEFFLASHLHRVGKCPEGYSKSIAEFWDEIHAEAS